MSRLTKHHTIGVILAIAALILGLTAAAAIGWGGQGTANDTGGSTGGEKQSHEKGGKGDHNKESGGKNENGGGKNEKPPSKTPPPTATTPPLTPAPPPTTTTPP